MATKAISALPPSAGQTAASTVLRSDNGGSQLAITDLLAMLTGAQVQTSLGYAPAQVVGNFTVGHMAVFDAQGRLVDGGQAGGGAGAVSSVAGRTGAVVLAAADISDLAASATTDTTNATNISSGTLAAARLPTATNSTLGASRPDGTTVTINNGVLSASGGTNVAGATITSTFTSASDYVAVVSGTTTYRITGDNFLAAVGTNIGSLNPATSFGDTTKLMVDNGGAPFYATGLQIKNYIGSVGGAVSSVAGRTGDVTLAVSDVSGALSTATAATTYAPLANPALTGSPTAPTQTAGDNSTKLATTAYVATAVGGLAPLASPNLTGSPTAPTQTAGDNSTKLATTAYVTTAVAAGGGGAAVPTIPNLQAGRFYTFPSAQSNTGAGGAATKVMLTPFFVPNTISLVSMSVTLGASVSSGTLCLGIYADSSGAPGSRLAQGSMAVSSSNASTTVSISVSVSLSPGLYWIAQSWTAAANATCYQAAAGNGSYGFNAIPRYVGATTAANAMINNSLGYYTTDTPGSSLPSTLTGLTVNPATYTPAVVALGF